MEQQLHRVKAEKQQDLIDNIEKAGSNFILFPYVIFTPQNLSNASHSSIGTLAPNKNPYTVLTGEYVLLLYDKMPSHAGYLPLVNYESRHPKIVLMDEGGWRQLYGLVIKFAVEFTKSNTV
ncbi:hypothetical protein GCM10028817_19630 [Spirosoma pomorum]